MAQNPFTSVERKWLSLYEPREGSLLAKRISQSNCMLSMASKPEAAQDAGVLPIELWLSIALHMGAAASRLAEVCWGLRPLSRHPELWEALCKAAFPLECGFRNLDVRSFGWSWRSMFMTRRRLRFDGLYYITTVKVMMGCQEGRGMKEAGKDFYRGPLAVTYHRIFRFFPSGDCWVYLTSTHPHDAALRRTARSGVMPARRGSIRRLNGACWGRFDGTPVRSSMPWPADQPAQLRLSPILPLTRSLTTPAQCARTPTSVRRRCARACLCATQPTQTWRRTRYATRWRCLGRRALRSATASSTSSSTHARSECGRLGGAIDGHGSRLRTKREAVAKEPRPTKLTDFARAWHKHRHACLSDRLPHNEQYFDVPQPVCSFVAFMAGGRSRDAATADAEASTDAAPSAAAPSLAGPSLVTFSS